MINFRLFGYPVRIEWMFWVICAILGVSSGSAGGRTAIYLLLMWVGVVFVSILWHEFGHALARRKFGQPHSQIVLHGFGGYCAGPGNFSRHQQMWISFAGPLASFILGGLIWLLTKTPGYENVWVRVLVGIGLWVNIGWAILNLLPIYPLDGGQIFAAFMANRKPSVVPVVGMVCAAAVAILGFYYLRSIWMLILFGLLAFQNWQRTQGQNPRRII